MKKHRHFFLFFFWMIGLFFVAAAGLLLFLVFRKNVPNVEQYGVPQPSIEERRVLVINDRQIPVEMARTAEETQRGLSFRDTLPENEGMYFVFPTATPQTFWMYGMRFPLDIIFIRDGIVLNVEQNVPPPKNEVDVPKTVSSAGAADAVLEINAGKAAAWGIAPGDEVNLPLTP